MLGSSGSSASGTGTGTGSTGTSQHPHPHPTPPRHRLLLAVTDPANADSLVTIANLFSPGDAALDVLWLQGNKEAPSAYMNSMESLRDPQMREALRRCTGRSVGGGNLTFHSLPSNNPWEDAKGKAGGLGCDIILCSHKLMLLSQGFLDVLTSMSSQEWGSLLGFRGSEAAEASAAAVAADRRPCLREAVRSSRGGGLHATLAVLFDHGCPTHLSRALSWGGQGVAEFLSLVPMTDLVVREVGGGAGALRLLLLRLLLRLLAPPPWTLMVWGWGVALTW